MNRSAFVLFAIAVLTLAAALFGGDMPARTIAGTNARTPVVAELFTSEGCSSCPPADLLLQKFDAQPIPGAQLIVLSEHVDYWNHIGWTDPYSSSAYSERQSAYGKRFQLDSVYTPELVVDGANEVVGSDSGKARKAFNQAVTGEKVPVRISAATLESNIVRAHLETGPLPARPGKADVVFVVALNHAESQVAGGENSGRRLTHVAVVRSLTKVGSVDAGQSFAQDISVKIEEGIDPARLRVIAFLQEPGPGKILGAALGKLSH
jgi:hypothetical protein